MPGFIKVAGEQRPVAVPYVKVAGAWKPVAIGWIKVAGEWKIWHTAEVVDNFNRADSPTLGTASNDFSTWTNLAGTWEVVSNQAETATTAGPHIASIPLYKATTDVTVEVDIPSGTGVGAAFWVQDASNWWAAIPGRRVQNNPSYRTCPSGYTLNGTQCIRTTFTAILNYPVPPTYTAPATTTYRTEYSCSSGALEYINGQPNCRYWRDEPADQSTQTTTSCPSGYTLYGSECRKYGTYAYSTSGGNLGCRGYAGCASLGGSCTYSQTCADLGYGPCACTITETTCYCTAGGGCDGTCFTKYQTASPTTSTTTVRTCPAAADRGPETVGGVWVCRYRTTNNSWLVETQVPEYGCAAATGYTSSRSGDTCTYTAVPPYCPSGFSRNNQSLGTGTECQKTEYASSTLIPASTSYPPVVYIYKSVAGTVTQENRQDIGSDPRSIKVTTSGSNVNVKCYSSAQASGTAYKSITYTTSNASKSTVVGIAKNGNQAVGQANFIDNFRAE